MVAPDLGGLDPSHPGITTPARRSPPPELGRAAKRIRAVHAEDNTQGAPRITAELNDNAPAGERVNHKRVARVMRLEGIRGYVKKRRVRTTIPEPSGQQYPDDRAPLGGGL